MMIWGRQGTLRRKSSVLLEVNVAEGRALQNRKVEEIENVFIGFENK